MRTYENFSVMVLYVNPYMVVTPRGYTKHYYNGSQRIAARLGDYWAASVADESDMIARTESTSLRLHPSSFPTHGIYLQ